MSGRNWLAASSFVNCWVVLWSCLDMYVIVGASLSPQDLLMDALGLLFLYNLDDIGGDLGFVDEDDWPGLRLGWIYDNIVHPCDDSIFDESQLDCFGTIFLAIYDFTTWMLVAILIVVPVLSVLTPFTEISPLD